MSRQLGMASLIWGMSILLSRVVGLVREAVLGRVLGGGSAADVFWTAFVIPDFLNYLLAGGALSLVFIPIFSSYLSRGEVERGWQAFSVIANFILVLLLLLVPALWVVLPQVATWVAPGFSPGQLAELVALTRIVLPAQVFHLVGGLLSAALQAEERHTLPALAPLVYTLGIIVGGLLGGEQAGAYGFAWGVLAGSAVGPFGLPLLGVLRSRFRWRLCLNWRHPDLRLYLWRSLPIMLGWSIIFVDDWILRQRGSLLATGAIATLQYSKNLIKVPMGVFGLAAGVATFPALSRYFAQGQRRQMYDTLSLALRHMLVPACAAQVVLLCAGYEIARVIYGGKLEAAQYAEISVALGWMALSLWAWAAQTLIARGFYAMGHTWLPTIVGTVTTVVSYPLYVWLGRLWGTAGLAMASSAAITSYVLILLVLLRRHFPGIKDRLGWFALRLALAMVLSVVAGRGVAHVAAGVQPLWWRGGMVGMAAMAAFGAMLWMLRVGELRAWVNLAGRPWRRLAATGRQ